MKKRCLGLGLAIALLLSQIIVPAGAEQVKFSDITDEETAVAVEVLRLLEVLDGMGDGSFQPYGSLTRSQFCKMAIHAMNKQGELGQYRTVTVFPDVKPSHWAAAYVNMAAKGEKMIAGYPDGKFHPEEAVTVGQAATILIRLLGYQDAELGGVWPDSHVEKAKAIGLMDGIDAAAEAVLTRGQAAKLFLNLLSTNTAGNTEYLSTLGTAVEAVLVSSRGGTDGKQLETAAGATYSLVSGRTPSGILDGSRGLLIVKQGKALTFVPEDADQRTAITLASCTAGQIIGTNGIKYTLSGQTKTYYSGEETTWSQAAGWLHAGETVSLSMDSAGSIVYVFVGGGTQSNQAVILSADASSAGLAGLTGGAANYKIYRNGIPAAIADLKKNDVATYSSVTNSVRVSDTRISVYYEGCSPTPSAPERITVLGGAELSVLPTAQSSVAKFKPGQKMTLLLTDDGQVAGAVEGDNATRSNAVGIVTEEGIQLLCGTTRILLNADKAAEAETYWGQLVRVTASSRGVITLNRLSSSVSGDLNVSAKMLGGQKLAENVMLFRDGKDVALGQLTSGILPAEEIVYVRTNWAGQVDLIGLKGRDATAYYGKAMIQTVPDPDEFDDDQTINLLKVEYGNDKATATYRTGYSVANHAYVAMRIRDNKVAGVSLLERIKDVPNQAWSGKNAVTVAGQTYFVPEDVLCYNWDSGNWVSLSEARAYSGQADLYAEDGIVRVLEVRYSG